MTEKLGKQDDIAAALPFAGGRVGDQHTAVAGTIDSGGTAAAPQSAGPISESRPANAGAARAADPFFSGRKHYPALDGLRALAIIGVIGLHFGGAISHSQAVAGGPLALALFKLFHHGAWGVDLFFVLSGYLITGILLQSRGQEHYFRNFYARRTLRIFPLYYGVLLAVLVGVPLALGHVPEMLAAAYRHQAWLWTYTSNFEVARKGLVLGDFGHFWTLAIEEQFYLVWPLVIMLVPVKRMFAAIASLVVVINIGRILFFALSAHAASAPVYEYVYNLTPFRADTLLAGAALAVWQSRGSLPQFRRAFILCFWATLPAVLLCYLGASRGWPDVPALLMVHVTASPLLIGSFMGIMLTSGPEGMLNRLFSVHALRAIGKYSYAMYVFHLIYLPIQVRYLPFSLFAGLLHSALLGLPAYYASAVGVAFCLALCSYHLYEKHFLKLKKYFPERVAGPIASPVPGVNGSRQ